MKLEISLFRFDKDSDYLPYYTKHFLKLTNEKNLLDILRAIYRNEKFSYIDSFNFPLVVNGKYLKTQTSLEDIINNFGTDLIIEPISIKRAYKDFLIDESDFQEKLELLGNFISADDIKFYEDLKIYHYSSNTLNFKSDYLGDAIILLAYDLIFKNRKLKEAILNILKSYDIGVEYHTSLKNRVLNIESFVEEQIKYIQNELNVLKEFKTISIDFEKITNFNSQDFEITHSFKDFNIAYYSFDESKKTKALLEKLDANILSLENLDLDLAKNSFKINPNLTYFVASQILLSAFDGGADFLLVDKSEDFFIFDSKRAEIEKICNREIPLAVIHISQLKQLICGDFENARKTLNKHTVKPEII